MKPVGGRVGWAVAVVAVALVLAPATVSVGPAASRAAAESAAAAATTEPSASGYWLAGADGAVFPFGQAAHLGSMAGTPLVSPVVTMAATSTADGYWLAAADGGMFTYGDAGFRGAMGGTPLNQPIVGMAPTPDDGGYWLVARDGGIFAFGTARFAGSMGGQRLNRPVVGMAPGRGTASYWLVASDGGLFSFGTSFHGSMGGQPLNAPIVGMAATESGEGYWMVASDGGIFTFGDARFHGSMGGTPLNRPIVGMAPTPSGKGYWLVADDGGIFSFGDAAFFGSTGGQALKAPITGLAVAETAAAPPGDPVVLAAGDIASCASSGDEATAALLDKRPGTVLPLGDVVYENGTLTEFQQCYDPSWGRHRGRTKPVPGNHEYKTPGAAGYFDYFGPAAGDRDKGYYSYNLGSWHVVALNSEDCADADGCPPGSPQEAWFRADLAANPAKCTAVYWHKARFSSSNGEDLAVKPLWDAAVAAGVDVNLVGHLHVYERFAPMDANGTVDQVNGMRQFIVGTGGKSHHGIKYVREGSEVRNTDTYGVLSMTLRPGSYDWEFVPVAGATFTDSGTDTCH